MPSVTTAQHGALPETAAAPIAGTRVLGLPRSLWLFMIVQMIAWVITPAMLNGAPELNTVEIGMWGHEWFWVNYKHPALPSWSMALAYAVFGVHVWVPYFVSQVFVCATYVFVFLLGRDLLGAQRALAGTMLLAGIAFFNVVSVKFNHNIAQMPFWAAFCFGLWRASQTNKWSWWSFAAAAAAFGLYAKFSTAMLIAFGCAWMLADARTRAHLRSLPPYLALGLFALLLAPLAYAIVQIDFLPFTWVSHESADKGVPVGMFLLGQMPIVAGFVALAATSGMFGWRRPATAATTATEEEPSSPANSPLDRRRLMFLILLGAGPLLLTEAMGVFARMRVEWTMPMFNLAGLLLVAAWPRTIVTPRLVQRLALISVALSVAIAAGYGTWTLYGLYHDRQASRGAYPMTVIARRFHDLWHEKTGHPLRIVGGDRWPASLVGLATPEAPVLFTHLDPQMAPSVTPDRVMQDGVLVLWRVDGGWHPAAAMVADHDHGVESFEWSANPDSEPIEIGWLILPPRS